MSISPDYAACSFCGQNTYVPASMVGIERVRCLACQDRIRNTQVRDIRVWARGWGKTTELDRIAAQVAAALAAPTPTVSPPYASDPPMKAGKPLGVKPI